MISFGVGCVLEYNATTTRIFDLAPYFFFSVIGIVFSSSLFILLLLKYGYSIPRYTKICVLSSTGLLIGAKLFGCLSGLYSALANKEPITFATFMNTGIVFLGGLIGFITAFLLICKRWNKKIDNGVMDLVAVCIPVFHLWARMGCFFAGCCYGVEANSRFSILYTNYIKDGIITASRIPIQLVEVVVNVILCVALLILLNKQKLKGYLLNSYLFIYSITRIILEVFRGDIVRGVWNGISFSQIISVSIIIFIIALFFVKRTKERTYEFHKRIV